MFRHIARLLRYDWGKTTFLDGKRAETVELGDLYSQVREGAATQQRFAEELATLGMKPGDLHATTPLTIELNGDGAPDRDYNTTDPYPSLDVRMYNSVLAGDTVSNGYAGVFEGVVRLTDLIVIPNANGVGGNIRIGGGNLIIDVGGTLTFGGTEYSAMTFDITDGSTTETVSLEDTVTFETDDTGDGLTVAVSATDTVNYSHNSQSPGNQSSTDLTFIDALTFDSYGHTKTKGTGTITAGAHLTNTGNTIDHDLASNETNPTGRIAICGLNIGDKGHILEYQTGAGWTTLP